MKIKIDYIEALKEHIKKLDARSMCDKYNEMQREMYRVQVEFLRERLKEEEKECK